MQFKFAYTDTVTPKKNKVTPKKNNEAKNMINDNSNYDRRFYSHNLHTSFNTQNIESSLTMHVFVILSITC